MRDKVKFPKSGTGIAKGTVVRCLKGLGDHVQKGDMLLAVVTAKALQEIEAPANRIQLETLPREGDVGAVSTTLRYIEVGNV